MEYGTTDLSHAITPFPVIGRELTHREVEVLRWSAEGNTAAEVAKILDVKSRTVNFHIGSAMRKMGVKNKTCAVVKAARDGMI